jgi:hypothetical protein
MPFYIVARLLIELKRQREEELAYDQMKIALAAYAQAAAESGDKEGLLQSLMHPEMKGKGKATRTYAPPAGSVSLFDAMPVNVSTSIVSRRAS